MLLLKGVKFIHTYVYIIAKHILIYLSVCNLEKAMATTPALLPGKSHVWRSLVGCSPWGHEELDTIE